MQQLKFYVEMKVEDNFLSDEEFELTKGYIKTTMQDVAQVLGGELKDLEIK